MVELLDDRPHIPFEPFVDRVEDLALFFNSEALFVDLLSSAHVLFLRLFAFDGVLQSFGQSSTA